MVPDTVLDLGHASPEKARATYGKTVSSLQERRHSAFSSSLTSVPSLGTTVALCLRVRRKTPGGSYPKHDEEKAMKRTRLMWTASVLALLLAAPGFASNGGSRGHWGEDQIFRFDLGQFEPRGDSEYWDDVELEFTGSSADFDDAVIGVEWVRFLGDRLGLSIAGSFYEGSDTLEYRRFEDQNGFPIRHTADLDISSFTIGLLLHITQRDRAIVPYVGFGGGVWAWRLIEVGDFIDFSTPTLEVFDDYFEDEASAVGYYWRAGLEVPLATNWSLYAEGRWQRVDDELGADFEGLGEIDLSGETMAAGLSVSF
jgi:opacity protein-like surface antigen